MSRLGCLDFSQKATTASKPIVESRVSSLSRISCLPITATKPDQLIVNFPSLISNADCLVYRVSFGRLDCEEKIERMN